MFGRGRRFATILVLLAAVSLAFACGGKSNSSNGSSDNSSSSNDSGAAAPTANDLRLLGTDPLTLDPAEVFESGSAPYVVEIFSGLMTIDKDLHVVPDLAEKVDVSPDGLTYTFTLRDNARFQDGRPVTANDVSYSLNRAAKLGQSGDSVTAEAYLGDIVGVKDVIFGHADTISGIKVIDDKTLTITIDQPKPYFLAKLTYPTAFVVDQQQVESNPRNWTRKPNGTGPFKMVEWRVNERIILQANENYYNGVPSVNRIFYNLAGGSSLTQYESNEVDISGIGPDDYSRVQSSSDPLSQDYKTGPELSVWYIAFNTNVPPFDDANVRRAFAMAIDRNQLATVVDKGMLPVANSFMMPGLPGYNKDATLPAFDPNAAKQALAQSKYHDAAGLGSITLTVSGAGATADYDTQALVQMWKDNLGVDVTISQEETATYFDDIQQSRLQMWTSGWIMDYPDPENLLDLLFYSKSPNNDSRYSNPDYDNLIVQARTEQDPQKRLQLYQQAEQILINDLPWIPLYFGQQHYVVKPYVKGFDPTPLQIPILRYVSIQK